MLEAASGFGLDGLQMEQKKKRFNFSGSSYSTGSCQLHNMWKKETIYYPVYENSSFCIHKY